MEVDKKYRIPLEYISCPGCGRKYGHHKTKVDTISEECSACCKEWRPKEKVNLVDATYFIEKILEITPF